MLDKRKKYKVLLKTYKKELTQINKKAVSSPYEYSYGLDYFITFIIFMRDYYKLGYNVIGADRKGEPKRLDTLNKVLKAYEEWQSCEKEFFKYHKSGGQKNKKGIYIEGIGWSKNWTEPRKDKDFARNLKLFNQEYTRRKNRFFMLISHYIEDWWD